MATADENVRKGIGPGYDLPGIRNHLTANINYTRQTAEQLKGLVVDGGDSNPEVVAARTDYKGETHITIGDRIDSDTIRIDDELASKASETRVETVAGQLANKAEQSYVDTMLSNILDGSPDGVFTTLAALKEKYPNGAKGTFLVMPSNTEESGHIYFWDGSSWKDGGVYQGIQTNPHGKFGVISDPINLNTETKVVSWPDTYLFGSKEQRVRITAGELSIASFGANAVIFYANAVLGTLSIKYATDTASKDEVFLGILFPANIRMSILNFDLTVDGTLPKVTSKDSTGFGRFAYVVDPIDFNTTTRTLSWGSTYVFGADLSRKPLAAGSLDLTSFGTNVPIIYYNSKMNTIAARFASDTATEDELFIGILWTSDLAKSLLNFKLTLNGSSVLINSSQTSSFGRYGYMSDPVNYDMTAKTLTWTDSYVFGISLTRLKVNAGSLDLSSYSGVVIIFYDTSTGGLVVRSSTQQSSDNLVFLGALWLSKPGISLMNFKLTVNGTALDCRPYNKTINFVGDSITNYNEYQQVVNQTIGFKKINNYGVGGTCLASSGPEDTSSMAYRVKNIDFTADIITVFGGTNDWGNIPAKPLGAYGDTTDTTIYGAIDSIITTIITNAPLARLVFITPLQRNFTNTSSTTIKGWSGDTANSLGYTLEDVVSAIQKVCGKYGVPVIDLYRNSGITKFNLPQMTRDGLHPNKDLGMVRIGNIIASELSLL